MINFDAILIFQILAWVHFDPFIAITSKSTRF